MVASKVVLWLYMQIKDCPTNVRRTNTLAYFPSVIDEERKTSDIDTCGQCFTRLFYTNDRDCLPLEFIFGLVKHLQVRPEPKKVSVNSEKKIVRTNTLAYLPTVSNEERHSNDIDTSSQC
jgi:hypothetical protein